MQAKPQAEIRLSASVSIPTLEFASQGNAVLGIRDSGKSYTATFLAEQLHEAGIPFVAFDPIGIWRNLKVPGKGKGYPVVVAAAEDGDLELTAHNAAEIVRAAMVANVPLVLDLYSVKITKADWRRIVEASVRVLLYENKAHGLRHIFIEEAAEFCPQRVGPEQGKVYSVIESLARMGGNAKLGYTLINQRAEEVNKAVLELCDCLFLHRQKGRNSLTALSKWLDFGNKTKTKEIIDGIAKAGAGECWLWPRAEESPAHVKMPTKNSFHPDRRGAHVEHKAAAVDVSEFVTSLRASLAEKEEAEQTKAKTNASATHEAAREEAREPIIERVPVFANGEVAKLETVKRELADLIQQASTIVADIGSALTAADAVMAGQLKKTASRLTSEPLRMVDLKRKPENQDGHIPPRQQALINALAFYAKIGLPSIGKNRHAAFVGRSNDGGYRNDLSSLRTAGLIDYPTPGDVTLTASGRAHITTLPDIARQDDLHRLWLNRLPPRQAAILKALLQRGPVNDTDKNGIAAIVGRTNDGGFRNDLSAMRTLGLIEYPRAGTVCVSQNLYPPIPA